MKTEYIYLLISLLFLTIFYYVLYKEYKTNKQSKLFGSNSNIYNKTSKEILNISKQHLSSLKHQNRKTRRLALRLIKRLKRWWFKLPFSKRNLVKFLDFALSNFNRKVMFNYKFAKI